MDAAGCLVNGPGWYSDYGLYRMQWGAKQLFTEAFRRCWRKPGQPRHAYLDVGQQRFLHALLPAGGATRVQMLNVDYYMSERRAG